LIFSPSFLSFPTPFYSEPYLHMFLFGFLDYLPPFSLMGTLPALTSERLAVLTELGVLALLCLLVVWRDTGVGGWTRGVARRIFRARSIR